jgi:hypothetical protein
MQSREDRIRDLAYRLWDEEGRPPDQERRHWQMAESALRQEEAEEAERKLVEGEPPGATPDEDAPAGEDVALPPVPPFQR